MEHPREPSRTVHRLAALVVVAVIASWVVSAVAFGSGSTLYASPSGSTSGSCTSSSAPCSLAYAVSSAVAGDTVVVAPGTYSLTSGLIVSAAITVEGQPGQARPSLVGATSLIDDTVTASGGAVLRDLDIETTTNSTTAQTSALALDGATAENLTVSAAATDSQGEALSIKDSTAGTVARTILAISGAPGGEAVSFKDSSSGAGTATVDHLTAIATGSSTDAISGNVVGGTITITNAIASSPQYDVITKSGTHALNLSHSDFATSTSGAVASGAAGNISGAPAFVAASSGNYQEAAGSPTIGAGVAQTGQTATDLLGTAWTASPDMGAYQYAAGAGAGSGTSSSTSTSTATTSSSTATTSSSSTTTTTSSTPTPSPSGAAGGPPAVATGASPLPAPSAPVAGVSVTLRPAGGTVTVAVPGSGTFVALGQAAQLPVGSVIDATAGTVTLTSATNAAGATKTGTFTGGKFTVTQTGGGHPLTDLRLTGGSFPATCAVPVVPSHLINPGAGTFRPLLRARGRPSHKVVRLLWGSDHGGHFVTIGRSASAAVRGTVWLTEDRCDGTLIAVRRGRVLVHTASGRAITVSAGHSYLAHARS